MTSSTEIPRRRLGRTGWMVTALGLGGYMYTGEFDVPRSEADAILDCAFEAGIRYFDTAAMYGFGESEELLGRALCRHPGQPAIVSTKVGWLDRTVVRNRGEAAYRDEEALGRVIKHSLWLLRRDFVEILMIHEPDWRHWGLDARAGDAPVVSVLEDLKRQGVIGAIGLGGLVCDNIADLLDTGRFDVALVAGAYSLVHQSIRERVIPAAKRHDVGLVIGAPFLQGLLATMQRARMEEIRRTGAYESGLDAPAVRRILAVYDLCDEAGMSITEMGVRYLLSDGDIHTVIPGAQRVAHLRANLEAAANGPLPADLVARIDRIGRMG